MSGEDAAWRDLVARFDLPGRQDGTVVPWPAREDLPPARHKQPGPGEAMAASSAATDAASASAEADTGTGTGESGSDGGQDTEAADTEAADTEAADTAGGSGDQPGADMGGPPAGAADRARVIKPAAPVQLPEAADDEDEDEHYIPPPPPPLPSLDPVAKGAWTALFGGPAYLLIATSAGWVLPGWATFGAVAAFVGGFTVLVIRMGDKPSRGSGPDNGAVL
jgi:hypothetical protein